jgi:hypothetical protein
MNWINVEDALPDSGDNVWYYFEHVGVWQGRYKLAHIEASEEFPAYDSDIFYCDSGFLGDDVTHWQPDVGQEKPGRPE